MLRASFCVSIAVVATFTWTTRISQSGKHIPVDVKTKQPHSCLQSRMYYDQNRRIFQCNSCGKDIRFSEFETSISSKRIPLNTKTGAHHRCKAKPFNRETRRQWWWYQQKKAEQQRQRNKQDHSYRLLSLSKHSEYAKTLGVAINATARKLKKHIIFDLS